MTEVVVIGSVVPDCIMLKCVSNVLRLQTNAQYNSDRQVHDLVCRASICNAVSQSSI